MIVICIWKNQNVANYICNNKQIQQTYDNSLIKFNKIYPCYMGKPIL